MLTRLSGAIGKAPWIFIALFPLAAAFVGWQLRHAEIDPAIKSQLPEDMPAREILDAIEDTFGGTDLVMVAITAADVTTPAVLEQTEAITTGMERVPNVERVLSVFTLKDIRADGDAMVVSPAVERIPRDAVEQARLRESLADNDLAFGNVLSEDFTATAVIGLLEETASDDDVLKAIRALIEKHPGPGDTHLAGLPYIRASIGADMQRDMRRFMPLGLLAMLIFLLICFRRWRGMALPAAVVFMSILVSMGLIPLLGWKIQLITIILPVVLIAVANDYGIHLIAHYQEHNRPDNPESGRTIAQCLVRRLSGPVFATGVTTVAGLLTLLTHIIVPAEQMGVLAAIGVAFALIASLVWIPAMLAVLPKDKPAAGFDRNAGKTPLMERTLAGIALLVTRRPKATVAALALGAVIIGAGLARVVVDTNSANYYEPGHPLRLATTLVNDKFGGATAVNIVAEGDIKDPAVLREIDALQTYLETLPNVEVTTSIADVVKRMNRVMNDDDPAFETIPKTREAVAQYFLLYSMSGDPDDFDRLVDFPYEHAQITARVNSVSTSDISAVVRATEEYIERHGNGLFTLVGGFARIFADLANALVRGQLLSLALSLALVCLLVAILFRSVAAGFYAVAPIASAMLILFGLMGHIGIELNLITTMLSSIMIGVGVDYTIHYLWRYREERRDGLTPAEAIRKTLTTTGRGIVFNALSVVVGFAVLLLSSFLPVQFFGFLVVVSISTCVVGALVALPALNMMFRPRFLEPIAAKGESSMSGKTIASAVIGALLIGSVGSSAVAQTPTAREIVEKTRERRRLDGSESVMTLTIINAKGQERVRKIAGVSKTVDDETEQRLLRFLEPADVKGVGLLTYDYETKDDDMWLYMPALRKTRRIVASAKAESFMGSEFAYADITPPPIDDFAYQLLGEETADDVTCWRIEATATTPEVAGENGFSKRVISVGKKDYVIRRAVYYDLSGEMLKELNATGVTLIDPEKARYRPTKLTMVNKQNGRKSVIVFDAIQLRRDIPDDCFTTRYLERG